MSQPAETESAPEPSAPEPSAEAPARQRSLKRRATKAAKRFLIACAAVIVPPLYCLYMWFVYLTSKVERIDTDLLWLLRERYGGLVGVMWHQEVFTVAWAFRDFEGHTLASRGDAGTLIAGMLKLNGFVVFRGGSSAGRARRTKVLPELIRHMQEVPGVAYGITCDGSNGPPYRLKPGSVAIAHATHKPMIVSRTWAKRRINFKSWDRAFFPLPFNRIVQVFAGPYFSPRDASKQQLEEFRREVEGELLELTHWVHEHLGEPAPAGGRRAFPPGWSPRWDPAKPPPRYPFEPPAGHPALAQEGATCQGAGARRRQARAVARSAGLWPARAGGEEAGRDGCESLP